jgi:hypothetical protein
MFLKVRKDNLFQKIRDMNFERRIFQRITLENTEGYAKRYLKRESYTFYNFYIKIAFI